MVESVGINRLESQLQAVAASKELGKKIAEALAGKARSA